MTRALLASLLLAACAAQGPAPGTAEITVSSGNFMGFTSTQIFADGTLISGSGTPYAPVYKTSHTTPAAFVAAAKVIAAEGAKTRAALKKNGAACLDYGSDVVSAAPPIAGFDQVSAQCPDPAINDLISHVLASLAQPGAAQP